MENRLCLNKRPIYELPDKDILIEYYAKRKKEQIPNFEPDLCLCAFGRNVGEHSEKKQQIYQLWVKTDNLELIKFIKSYNWRGIRANAPNAGLSKTTFKKIVLEEYYGGKDDRE